MRIRLLDDGAIAPGATLDGEVLLESDLTSCIDNMEGIAVWQAGDGTTRVTLVSDDNFSPTQDTHLLEFVLKE